MLRLPNNVTAGVDGRIKYQDLALELNKLMSGSGFPAVISVHPIRSGGCHPNSGLLQHDVPKEYLPTESLSLDFLISGSFTTHPGVDICNFASVNSTEMATLDGW